MSSGRIYSIAIKINLPTSSYIRALFSQKEIILQYMHTNKLSIPHGLQEIYIRKISTEKSGMKEKCNERTCLCLNKFLISCH